MARERFVTRTIKENEVKVLGMNLETCNAETRTLLISGEYDDFLKVAQALYNDDTFTVVKIMDVKSDEVIYKMRESDFMKYAVRVEDRFDKIWKAETGQKAPSGKDGNFTADDGKPKNKKEREKRTWKEYL